jgi:hypothetical protein
MDYGSGAIRIAIGSEKSFAFTMPRGNATCGVALIYQTAVVVAADDEREI